jgi:hypothetical protein
VSGASKNAAARLLDSSSSALVTAAPATATCLLASARCAPLGRPRLPKASRAASPDIGRVTRLQLRKEVGWIGILVHCLRANHAIEGRASCQLCSWVLAPLTDLHAAPVSSAGRHVCTEATLHTVKIYTYVKAYLHLTPHCGEGLRERSFAISPGSVPHRRSGAATLVGNLRPRGACWRCRMFALLRRRARATGIAADHAVAGSPRHLSSSRSQAARRLRRRPQRARRRAAHAAARRSQTAQERSPSRVSQLQASAAASKARCRTAARRGACTAAVYVGPALRLVVRQSGLALRYVGHQSGGRLHRRHRA